MEEEFMTTSQLADLIGVQNQTARAWRHRGEGPSYIRIGGKHGRVLYRRSDVEAWLRERTYTSTSEESA